MTGGEHDDFDGPSLLELFCSEAESQAEVLSAGLLALEREPTVLGHIEPVMRAAHSLKGAARIVGLDAIERLAHAMEDCLVAAQKGRLQLDRARIDRLLEAVDVIAELASLRHADIDAWLREQEGRIAEILLGVYEAAEPRDGEAPEVFAPGAMVSVPPDPLHETLPGPAPEALPEPVLEPVLEPVSVPEPVPAPASTHARTQAHDPAPALDAVLRVDVRRFDRLLGLVSEMRVAAHAFTPQLAALQRLRQKQHEALHQLDPLHVLSGSAGDSTAIAVHERMRPMERMLADRLAELDAHERRLQSLSQQMLDEVLALRMRPFQEGVAGFARMVRDLAHDLGKEAHFELSGAGTPIDRELLARIEAPLSHVVRNAVDHGLELPSERIAAGKPQAGTIRMEAKHAGGMLHVTVSDDGRGIDPEQIRRTLVARAMCNAAMAASMSNAELLDFLLLPGFSLKETTTAISGRGVGMDVVADVVRRMNGSMHIESNPGQGFKVALTLPLSQSLLRSLVVVAAGELLAFPLAHVLRVVRVPVADVHALAERQFFTLDEQHVDLIPLAPLLELGMPASHAQALSAVVIGNGGQRYALVVDEIVGERQLAVQPLPPVLGKLRDVAGTALLEDGQPVLVLDHADLQQGIEKRAGDGTLLGLSHPPHMAAFAKRVLVVDDSLTVREMQRKLLVARGYQVDVAVDGMDGWNAVRGETYDLVITDVDMPRLDGIELVSLIKKEERLRNLPVMIVSYKDRPEDRLRGIDAGADYYLAKGSFHDETLLEAVADLIGESGA